MTQNTTESEEDKKWICGNCYELGKPLYTQYGNWLIYIPALIGILLLIAIPSLIWLAFIFILFIGGRGLFDIGTLNPFPLAQFIPEAPHIVKSCRHCNAVEQMQKVHTRPGQDSMYWREKKLRGGDLNKADKQGNLS